ncbi:MAG: DNA-formamidopyrimidine glycosylase family protein, partial [Gammaproteobacteria bacterium]
MPELPEVEITKRGVDLHFTGQRLLACTVRQPRLRWPVPVQVQSCVKQILQGVER